MTSKKPPRTNRAARRARESVRMAHEAVEQVASLPGGDVELDPASRLFFEYAAPLLLTARNEHEFQTASALAEFVWATSHFDAHTQVALIHQFIDETNVSDELIPWLLDVYAELAERKAALLGE